MARVFASALVAEALALPCGAAAAAGGQHRRALTHGVVVGDVTPRSALLWARGGRGGVLRVRLSGGPHRRLEPVHVKAADDWTGQVRLDGLAPARRYSYRVRFDPGGLRARGSLRTPPADTEAASVRLAFRGDVAGQNICRDAAEGVPDPGHDPRLAAGLFVGLGDMIYADNACAATGLYGNAQLPGAFGPAIDVEGPASRRLLGSTSYIGVWDDHEVINDFGPLTELWLASAVP